MRKTSNAPFVSLFLILLIAFASLAVAAPPLAEGKWTKKTASISGSWSIVEEGGSRFLVLSDDFKRINSMSSSSGRVGCRTATERMQQTGNSGRHRWVGYLGSAR